MTPPQHTHFITWADPLVLLLPVFLGLSSGEVVDGAGKGGGAWPLAIVALILLVSWDPWTKEREARR